MRTRRRVGCENWTSIDIRDHTMKDHFAVDNQPIPLVKSKSRTKEEIAIALTIAPTAGLISILFGPSMSRLPIMPNIHFVAAEELTREDWSWKRRERETVRGLMNPRLGCRECTWLTFLIRGFHVQRTREKKQVSAAGEYFVSDSIIEVKKSWQTI